MKSKRYIKQVVYLLSLAIIMIGCENYPPGPPPVENQPPVITGLNDISLPLDFGTHEIDFANYVSDQEGEIITYLVSNSNDTVITISLDYTVLTITEVGTGPSDITVIATDGHEGHEVVDTFTEAGFSGKELEDLSENVPKAELIQILLWIENLLSSQRIIKDLSEASTRISTLVGAIKSHVHMDRTNEKQPTNIHQDIDNTITLLGHKIREKNITLKKSYCENLVSIQAYIGELNQVWTNIIDNAIYAVPQDGEVLIETTCDKKNVNVKIIDNGAGIPPEIQSRIFDPFFTTKKVGEGTGIGLDIVQRIIKRHDGEIKVHSKPGRTEFLISMPIS